MIREAYYAIVIGSRQFHTPYFLLGPDGKTPRLFSTKDEALKVLPDRKHVRVTRVELVEKKGGR